MRNGAPVSKVSSTDIIIIITRPKPAYGRPGLAGSWGQDTDGVSTCGAQVRLKPTRDH